jgi:hypothetical protein
MMNIKETKYCKRRSRNAHTGEMNSSQEETCFSNYNHNGLSVQVKHTYIIIRN